MGDYVGVNMKKCCCVLFQLHVRLSDHFPLYLENSFLIFSFLPYLWLAPLWCQRHMERVGRDRRAASVQKGFIPWSAAGLPVLVHMFTDMSKPGTDPGWFTDTHGKEPPCENLSQGAKLSFRFSLT